MKTYVFTTLAEVKLRARDEDDAWEKFVDHLADQSQTVPIDWIVQNTRVAEFPQK